MTERPILTTTAGAPVADNQNSITAGPRGPLLLEDYQLIEKLAHQNRERIPERTVHAKGWGAFGTLTITGDISKYTKAKCLQPGAKTDMLARFSTVAGELGAADAERDVRGFALKFYTEEGNWDLVGNNTPVFFVRDAYKFPGLHPHPEAPSAHQHALADRDVGFLVAVARKPAPGHDPDVGSRAADLADAHERVRQPYLFLHQCEGRTPLGEISFQDPAGTQVLQQSRSGGRESERTANPPRRLCSARSRQENFRAGRCKCRVMPEADVGKHWYNPFDLTKVWPHADYPPIDVGYIELNRNPENYFQQIELAAFSPSNVVPGISWSPDKMLQARIFSYADAHRHRLGTHYEALPVNAPRCPVHNYHKDGAMRFFPSATNPDAYYEPNSFNGPVQDERFKEPPLKISGNADRYDHRDGNDDYRQPGELFRLIGREAQQRLLDNTAEAMHGVPLEIVKRWIAHCYKADPEYGKGLAARMGLSASDLPSAKAAE